MSTTEAAKKILSAWDALRSGDASDAQVRETMSAIRSELGETGYTFAKMAAAAADSRR